MGQVERLGAGLKKNRGNLSFAGGTRVWKVRGVGGRSSLPLDEGLPVVKKSAGEERSVYLGLSSDVHRTLRHLAAEHDVSVPRLLKNMINEFIAIRTSAQQSVPEDFPELVPTEMSNGEEIKE